MSEHRPSLKRRRGQRPYPKAYKKALAKMRTRAARREVVNPGVALKTDDDGQGVDWGPLYRGDDDFWWLQLADAFGTVASSVIESFMDQLIELSGGRHPDQTTVNAAISIIGSYKPKTEGEAMLAAQMVAVHTLTMKAAAYANSASRSYIPEREARLVFRGARTFAEQTDTMARLKGRKGEQHIHVHYEDRRQIVDGDVHVHRGARVSRLPTPDANDTGYGKPVDALPPPEPQILPPLRSEDQGGHAMPGAEGEGPTEMQAPRRRTEIRRAAR
jgi:hypothetical protein